jgi:hypothetical protein
MTQLRNCAFFLLLLAFSLAAQEVTGSIVGTVVDSSGAAVPGAAVTVLSIDRNQAMSTTTTSEQGEFVATLLPIGKYSLKAEKTGFKAAVRSGIELHVSDRLSFRLVLDVGNISETVTVAASSVAVETQSSAAEGLVSGAEMTELSLNNRNFTQLLTLVPGITSNSATDEVSVGITNPLGNNSGLSFSINGGRPSGNNYMIDGADNVDRGSNVSLLAYPSVDAIAEFKVLRGLYSAEFGRGATGQVNAITKSGTNQFHGGVYEFFRNDKLAANNFFNNQRNIDRPELRYNNFGYTLGGPVPFEPRKAGDPHKTFFFWSQEFRRIIGYSTLQSTVPTDAMKKGIFAHPVCTSYNGNTCVAPASQITNIDPIAAQYIKDIWSQIPGGDSAAFNLFSSQRVVSNYREELIKIDHRFTVGESLSVRYLHDAIPSREPGGLFTGAVVPNTATTTTNAPGQNWTVRLTSMFTPSLLNEAGWSYSYDARLSEPVGLMASKNSPDIQAKTVFPVSMARVPSLTINGISTLTGYGPYHCYNRNHNIFDNLTKMLGRHTLKFGVSVNIYQKTENAATTNVPSFAFVPASRPSGTLTAEQGWANFLLGNVSTYSQASLDLTPDIRAHQFEAYVQDDYRLTSRLTVNMGVRYSLFRQPYDANGMMTNFDPALYSASKAPQIDKTGNIVANTGDALNGISINGSTSPYGNKIANENTKNFAPRFGLAWDPFGNGLTAIRSGYGVSFDSTLVGIYEQNIFGNPPYVNSVTITNTQLSNPTAGVVSVSAAPKVIHGTPMPAATPYTQQWSLDVQRQVGRSLVMAAGYYGSKSTHLIGIVDINEAPPGLAVASGILTGPATSTTTPLLNQIRPFRGYAAINSLENWFNSNYNSLQVSAQRQFTGGSSLRASYTWSKVMTDNSSDRGYAPQNFYNRAADYARATFDRTQVLTVSYMYALPLARASKGVVAAVAKGWQLTGIASFNSGLPLLVTTSGTDPAGLGIIGSSTANSNNRPDMIANPNANAPHTVAQWFNTKAFATVPAGQYRPGNAPAVSVQGPGFQRWDVSLFKVFQLTDRCRLQFRGETFNFPNHTNLQAISTSFTAANYGQVTSARDARRVQVGLKLSF